MPIYPHYSSTKVVGSLSDGHTASTLYGMTSTLLEHIHMPSKVRPTLAGGVSVPAVNDAGTWTLGAVTEIVAADVITADFDIHHVSIENISANNVYELVLYYGAGDTECGRVRFTKTAVMDSVLNIPMQTNLIPANSRIRAALASATNDGETATISVFYHTY